MYEENIFLLIIALAESAANEYREYKTILKNRTLNRNERAYFKLRAEETLNFFDSPLFITAFGEQKANFIKEELRKEN